MSVLTVQPESTHRDHDDVIKFPGRFDEFDYGFEEIENYDLTHRVEWATPSAVVGGGAALDPLHRYLAVKNMGTDPVLLHLNTQANAPNPAFEVTVLPGHWVEYVDLWMTVQPSIRVDSALYSNPVECEILQIGEFTPIKEIPEEFCDLWAVGKVAGGGGVLTKHDPELPGPWEEIINAINNWADWGADVAGVAEDDYWLVGYKTVEGFPASGLFGRWAGAAWAEVVVESSPPMYGVWGFASNDYWAVGGPLGGPGEIYHFDVGWTLDCVPGEQGVDPFYCVHGDVPANIYAAGGYGLIASYNGAVWVVHPPPVESPDVSLYGTWTSALQVPYVCGGDGEWWSDSGGIGWIFMEAPPGSQFWQSFVLPPGCPTLRAMWGFNDADIWAVGDQGWILHYDGVAWTRIPEPVGLNGNYDYRGVFGCWPWGVWAIGTTQAGTNVIIFWDGVTWTVDDGPDVLEGDLLGLKGVWVAS